MELIQQLSQELKLRPAQVEAAVRLLDEGNTIPFIARYRKEMTDSLDDAALRDLSDRLEYLRNLQKRREEVIRSITEQEKLTPELETAIQAAATLAEVEDLYRPYRPKRRTRGSIAREKGLEPLAAAIRVQNTLREPLSMAAEYVNPEKGVETAEDALSGAMDIIAEDISDDGEIRKALRLLIHRAAVVTATGDSTENTTYKMYYDFKEPVGRIAPHRVLAINRGEKEGFLKTAIVLEEEKALEAIRRKTVIANNACGRAVMEAAADSWKRLIAPSMENETFRELFENASEQAIRVFAENLHHLLMQPPLTGQVVLGWDPGYRNGCKLAVVDATGRVLDTAAKMHGFGVTYDEALLGGCAIDAVGEPLPAATVESCKKSDAVLLGAVGGYKWDKLPGNRRPEAGLLGIRSALGLFANLRPAQIFEPLRAASPLRADIIGEALDVLVVRELTGGIYFGTRGREEADGIVSAFDTERYSVPEIERVARVGFDMAMKRRKKLCSVDKANVLESSRLWRETVVRIAQEYPEVELSHMYVDNCAMQLVRNPGQFDVILTSNIFGDILSDELSMISGSIGMLASASLAGGGFGLYEPIHGSAPDIAGQDIANPLATILSVAMLLRYSLGEAKAADEIEAAVNASLRIARTGDIADPALPSIGCRAMGELVCKQLAKL